MSFICYWNGHLAGDNRWMKFRLFEQNSIIEFNGGTSHRDFPVFFFSFFDDIDSRAHRTFHRELWFLVFSMSLTVCPSQPSQTHSAYKVIQRPRTCRPDDAANISTITTSYECFCLRCRSYCWQRVHCSHRIFRCQRIFEIFILFNFMRIEEKKRQPIAHIDLKKKKAGFCWLLKFKLIINFWKEKKRNRTTHDRI